MAKLISLNEYFYGSKNQTNTFSSTKTSIFEIVNQSIIKNKDLSIVLSSLVLTILRVSSDYLFTYNVDDLLVLFAYIFHIIIFA